MSSKRESNPVCNIFYPDRYINTPDCDIDFLQPHYSFSHICISHINPLTPMAVSFSLTSGEMLELKKGKPGYYSGPLISGSAIWHASAAFGNIILQEVNSELVSFNKLLVQWKKPAGIICDYNYQPGIFTRAVLDNSLHEYIKGAGEIHLDKGRFASLAGSNWKGLLMAAKPGEHIFLDAAWSSPFIEHMLLNDPVLNEKVKIYTMDILNAWSGLSILYRQA